MKAEAVETGIAISGPFWINDIFYNSGQLVIKINSKDDDQCVTATFSEICGFRILDEGDLLEFWPTCSQGKGWLFRVIDGERNKDNRWFEINAHRWSGTHPRPYGQVRICGQQRAVAHIPKT
jgi:hypothetical protein